MLCESRRCAHPLGHEHLGFGRDRVVLVRDEIPRWDGLPSGPRSHSRSGRPERADAAWPRITEAEGVVSDVQIWAVGRSGRVVRRRHAVRREHRRRERSLHARTALTLVDPEAGEVDERAHVRQGRGRLGDDGATMGVPDEDDGTRDRCDDCMDCGGRRRGCVGGSVVRRQCASSSVMVPANPDASAKAP